MATDKSQSAYRGILVPDPRLTQASLWAAESSYTQATPLPGVPEAQGDYELVLQSGGTQSASKALRIQSLRGGHPIPNGGGFVWKNNADAATLWRGWDVPNVATKWEAVEYTATVGQHEKMHMIALPNGKLVLAETIGTVQISTRTRLTTGVWNAPVTVSTLATVPTFDPNPCLCLLPDGSILLFHWIEDSAVSEAQVRVWRSLNDGATWTMVQSHALREWKEPQFAATVAKGFDYSGAVGAGLPGYDPGRLRAAYLQGQIMLVAEARLHDNSPPAGGRDMFVQWASDDLGENFTWIDTWSPVIAGQGGRFHELLAVNGKYLFLYVDWVGTGVGSGASRTAGSAFEPLANSTAVALDSFRMGTDSAQFVIDGDLAACVDEDDAIWVLGRHATTPTWNLFLQVSYDYGATWDLVGQSSVDANVSMVVRTSANAVYMENLTMAPQWGRLVVAHTWESTTGTYDDSLGILYLGGSSTVTMPGFQKYATDLDRVGWEVWWGPLDVPNNMGWTPTGAGTSVLQSPGEIRITTAAQQRYFSRVPAGTGAQGITLLADLQAISGGDPGTENIGVRLVNSTTNDVTLRIGQTAIRVWDNVAGAQVGGDILIAPSGGVQILASMAASKISVWARATDVSHDRKWTAGPTNAALSVAASVNADFRWGNLAAGGTATSDWVQVSYTSDQWNGLGLHTSQINPDDLWARTYSRRLLSVDDGVRIQAADGPARRGDTYNIDTRYEFPVTRILPAEGETRSPRVRWRSTDTSQQRIAFALDTGLLGTQDSRAGHDVYGIGLFGINWRTGLLQRYDADTATWVTMATLDAATGMTTLEYTRRGHTVEPSTPTDKPQLFTGEMVGGTFALSATTFRKVRWHGEGVWDGISGKRLSLQLSGVLAGDPTPGTGALWSPNLVAIVHAANNNPLSAWRIQIDAQSNVDGYFEIGKLVIGPVYLFGTQYSWGRSIENVRGWRREVAKDGSSRVRNAAPDPYLVEFGWTEGVDIGNALGADPDYIRSSETGGASSVASRHGTPMEVQALSRLARGQAVVYLPRVPKSTGGAGTDVLQLVRPHHMLYGVVDSDVRIETVLGDEMESANDGEVQRVAAVTIREEV